MDCMRTTCRAERRERGFACRQHWPREELEREGVRQTELPLLIRFCLLTNNLSSEEIFTGGDIGNGDCVLATCSDELVNRPLTPAVTL